MKFVDLVNKVSHLPCFSPRFLAAGEDISQVRLQISRWVKDGRVIRIHKGLYCLGEPYRKVKPELFCIANSLKSASYVSLHSALSFYNLIPEFVPTINGVTTDRPQTIETPLGRFDFRHIRKKYFFGYKQIELSPGQKAFIAEPEKALLDLIYLTAGADSRDFIDELRLQNLEILDPGTLNKYTKEFQSPKLSKAVKHIEHVIEEAEGTEL